MHCLNNTIRYPNMGTVKQAAEIYGLSPHYIRRLCKTGKVRYVNAGRGWLVNLDSLARYFEQGDPAPAEPKPYRPRHPADWMMDTPGSTPRTYTPPGGEV